MLPRWFDLYETLTTFYHAFVQKWLKKDDPLQDTHEKIMQVIQFTRDTLSVFLGDG